MMALMKPLTKMCNQIERLFHKKEEFPLPSLAEFRERHCLRKAWRLMICRESSLYCGELEGNCRERLFKGVLWHLG